MNRSAAWNSGSAPFIALSWAWSVGAVLMVATYPAPPALWLRALVLVPQVVVAVYLWRETKPERGDEKIILLVFAPLAMCVASLIAAGRLARMSREVA